MTRLRSAQTPPGFITLVSGPAVSIVSLNMFLPALPRMAEDLGVSYAQASLAFSGYLAVIAALQLALGPLSDRFGRRPVLLAALGIFVLASIGCALATRIETLLAWRAVQAVVIGASTVSAAAVRDVTGPAGAASRLGALGMVMAIGPMVGPMIGGLLDQAFGWRAVFWALAGLGAAAFTLAWLDFGETNTRRNASMLAQFRGYPAVMQSGVFWSCALVMTFGIGCFYVFLAGAPLVAEGVFDLPPAAVGIALGIITAGFFLGNALSKQLSERAGLGRMILAGRISAVVGMALSALALILAEPNVWVYFGCVVLVGLGNGLSTPSANAGVMSVDPALAGSAAGLAGAMIMAGGAVLTSGVGWVLVQGWMPVEQMLVALISTVALVGLLTGVWAYRGLRATGVDEPVS
ncbi:MFS transporter [Shimia ponticola]|uniref:MFS transporter n=1 Tax=Shimia ponticola TaxID=2582893 RepID=UPI0011BD5E79|nr:MFS transporter [Shimia ponticola]